MYIVYNKRKATAILHLFGTDCDPVLEIWEHVEKVLCSDSGKVEVLTKKDDCVFIGIVPVIIKTGDTL